MGCGHSTFSDAPISYCEKARLRRGKLSRDASPRQAPLKAKDTDTGETVDRNTQPGGARPPPATSLLTTPSSPQEKNTSNSPKRRRSPTPTDLKPCRERLIHPLHTVRVESLCSGCEADRADRLNALAMFSREIKFDPNKWKWKYSGGGGGGEQPPTPKKQHVEGEEESETSTVADGERKTKAASGALASAVWLKDWMGDCSQNTL